MSNKKTLMLVMLFFMISFLSKAQYEKDTKFWQIQGTFSGNIASINTKGAAIFTTDNATHNIALTFKRAVFTEDFLAKGWLLDYNLQSNSYASNNISTNNNYFHTIKAGYFVDKFKPLSKSLAIYGEIVGKVGYGFRTGNITYTYDYNTYQLEAGVNFGVRYFLKKNLFINGQTSLVNLNLQHSKIGIEQQTNLNLNSIMNVSSLSISIGKTF
ncbi:MULTISPECIES: hypothetical protein [unclassified Arcicella]|uniref:hypothetical protein n=1 Tax=unclassified Arcicella TaxID=2644986 RepID=UPI0028668E48|nr:MULTISPECIES: hypothetical protein [unclassified Arcicella]MDR6559914.1 hypothetical protein [Arcicella sp. BE51]MDR6810479.1 hypothetical protein [Arcicella sp. BE140]MDR6821829.1 hypothetical protein [Arcicella sp. BE139]